MIIRQETEKDFSQIHEFLKTALQMTHSEENEQDYVENLRTGGNYIPGLALVAENEEDGNKIIGYAMLTKIAIKGVAEMPKNKFEILLLAPVAIDTEQQNKGFGEILIRENLKRAKDEGYAAVILAGNPVYYKRFGFTKSSEFGIQNKQNISEDNVLVLEFVPGILDGMTGTIDFNESDDLENVSDAEYIQK